jgi:hypothetical protein
VNYVCEIGKQVHVPAKSILKKKQQTDKPLKINNVVCYFLLEKKTLLFVLIASSLTYRINDIISFCDWYHRWKRRKEKMLICDFLLIQFILYPIIYTVVCYLVKRLAIFTIF